MTARDELLVYIGRVAEAPLDVALAQTRIDAAIAEAVRAEREACARIAWGELERWDDAMEGADGDAFLRADSRSATARTIFDRIRRRMTEGGRCPVCGERVPIVDGVIAKHVRVTALPDRIGPPCCPGSDTRMTAAPASASPESVAEQLKHADCGSDCDHPELAAEGRELRREIRDRTRKMRAPGDREGT